MKIRRLTAVCAALALLAGGVQFAHAAEGEEAKKESYDREALETQLEAARERLEEAAREVAELSGQLSGPAMRELMTGRHERRAMLGINVGEDASKGGVVIESVTPGGPAGKAGLRSGDVIVSIDGKSLKPERPHASASSALIRHLRTVEPGAKVQVEYLRDGKPQKTEVETAEARQLMGGRTLDLPLTLTLPRVRFHDRHGILDMELVTLTPKLGSYFGTDKGVLVVGVPEKSALRLEEGDVIVDIDGRVPQNGAHAMRILRSYQPGEKIALNVLRHRKSVKLDATMPEDAEGWGQPFGFEVVTPEAPPRPAEAPPAPPAPPAKKPAPAAKPDST